MDLHPDFAQAPFDALTRQEQDRLASECELAYFSRDHVLQHQGQTCESLFIPLKGRIVGEDESGLSTPFLPGDLCDSKSLLAATALSTLRACEDSLVWCLPRTTVLALAGQNPAFGARFYQDIASGLQLSVQRQTRAQQQPLLHTTPASLKLPTPLCVAQDRTVIDTLREMENNHSAAALIEFESAQWGIFTLSDLRRLLLAGSDAYAEPVGWHASRQLVCIDADDTLGHAMLLLVRHRLQRLVVTRGGTPCAILTQSDLLDAMLQHPGNLMNQIEQASDPQALQQVASRISQLAADLQAHGMQVTQIAATVNALRHQLFARLFAMLASAGQQQNCCLLVLGSEGRGEQILRTDQDNALIVREGFHDPGLPALCQQLSLWIERFGYPPCPGGVMLKNAPWCQSESGYLQQFRDWLRPGNSEGLLMLAIWLDASVVAGAPELLEQCNRRLRAELNDDAGWLARFARPIEQFDTPLGWFSRLRTGEDDRLDLKKGALFPITHGLRSLALEAGLWQITNSHARLAALREQARLPATLARDLEGALRFCQDLHLREGLRKEAAGHAPDYRIDPEQLTGLERELLKDSLNVVKQFRQLLRHHFHLEAL